MLYRVFRMGTKMSTKTMISDRVSIITVMRNTINSTMTSSRLGYLAAFRILSFYQQFSVATVTIARVPGIRHCSHVIIIRYVSH